MVSNEAITEQSALADTLARGRACPSGYPASPLMTSVNMMKTFDNVGLDPETHILFEIQAKLDDYEVLYQQWTWSTRNYSLPSA
jgi:hypothetical protein